MPLDKATVENIAHLARLSIEAGDVAQHLHDLSNILDLVNQMNSVDTANVTPMAHPLDMRQRLRPDVVTEAKQRRVLQSIAPQVKKGLYLVPKVID